MSGDIRLFIEEQRRQILEDKRRLGILKPPENNKENKALKNQNSFKPQPSSEQNKTNQVKKEVEKPQKNWVACNSVDNPLEKQENRENIQEKQAHARENHHNEVKKCKETAIIRTTKACENYATHGKENNANACNTGSDIRDNEITRNRVDNKHKSNKETNNENTVRNNENNKENEEIIDKDNNVKNAKSEVFIQTSDLDTVQLNRCDSELKLDLKDITEDRSFEEGENIIYKKNQGIDTNIGKEIASDPGLFGFEVELFDAKSDASRGLHAHLGPLPPQYAGGAPMDHAPSLPRPILRRGEYSHYYASSPANRNGDSRLRAEPHCGLGEYELSRALFAEKRRRDYLRHLAKHNESEPFRKTSEDSIRVTESETRLLDKILESPEPIKSKKISEKNVLESASTKSVKSVQTDIQNINTELVQYELLAKDFPGREFSGRTVTDELVDSAYRKRPYTRIDQRLTSAQNELLLSGGCGVSKTGRMDKPKGILSNRRTGSPRSRYGASNSYDDYEPAYTPSSFMDGFSYSDRGDDLERERLKRENYQHDLRLQIEEKRRLQEMRTDQERRERELENKRLEQQILRIREEAAIEDSKMARRNELMRRHSDDLVRRNHELQLERRSWRRHADSESGALDTLGLGTSSALAGSSSHYSPPVSRRVPYSFNVPSTSVFAETSSRYNPSRFESSSYSSVLRNRDTSLNRMDSLNSYDTSTVPFSHRSRKFDRFDSLSRIDSLTHRLDSMNVRDEGFSSSARLTDVERRHSATQQDLSLSSRRSPRSRRRNSSSRFEDSLPIPVLKARSPVAKELKHAIPFSSSRTSDVQRRLEDRWQIPAVQKTIYHTSVSQPESPSGHQSRGSILTQLGAIRSQLQREQLRMDETLRRRGLARARSTDYGGY